MQKEDVLTSLRNEMPTLKKRFGVNSIGVFGSYAKSLQNEESDIDFFVDLMRLIVPTFLDFGII